METPDLAGDQVVEEREAPVLQSPMGISDRTGLLEDEMDQKENLCSIQEDNLGTSMKKKRNRKGGGCNLRKSLAWNPSFFTEEGVLDPRELNILSRSSTKSSGNLLSVSEMSPLTMQNKSGIRPPLHDLVTNSQRKDSKPRKLFSSSNEESESHVISGKTPSAKGIFRSTPQLPATYSQKRVAHGSTTNPTSKLPKFMPTKSQHAPPPIPPRNAALTTQSSKSEQTAVKANVGQNVNVRLAYAKTDSTCTSSSSSLAGGHGRNMVESCTASLKVIPNRSSLTKHEIVACGTGKVAPSLPQSINHSSGGLPAPVHARPSALRMPSPSLGFFCQGKVSPSYNNQHQRHTQPFVSKIPSLKQPMNLRQNGHLRPLTISVAQQPMKATAAANSGPPSVLSNSGPSFVISSNSQACLAASSLKPPAIPSIFHVETNSGMKQADLVNRRASINSESSYCIKDSQEHPGYDRLLVGQDIHKQPGVLPVQKLDSDRVKELNHDDSSSKINNEYFVHGIQQFLRTNVPENVCDGYPPAEVSNASTLSCSNESQVKLQESDPSEIQDGSLVGNLAAQAHEKVDETYPVAVDNKQSYRDADFACNLGSEVTPRSIAFADSTEAKLSLKEETAGSDLDNSLELDHSVSSSSRMCDQVSTTESVCMTGGMNRTLSERSEPACFENMELQECRLHCSTNAINSRDKMGTDTSRQKVLLNVVPFSDEWVAALEALGEDILEKKTGPVQNSPPDKALPEPGPWSPVKKKAQDVGPFDCTKYSKNLTTSDTH